MSRSARPLERVFERELPRFVAAYPHLARTRCILTVTPRGRNPRSYAWSYPSRLEIWFVEKVLELPEANIVALVRHELGHLAEPGTGSKLTSEQHADDVAEKVTGERIHYDENDVQTTGPGVYPRPKYLPR